MRILTINTGSSSLKAALYDFGRERRLILSAKADRIGLPHGKLRITDPRGAFLYAPSDAPPDHGAALDALFAWLRGQGAGQAPNAVGHRVVHGGSAYSEPRLITDQLAADLRRLVPLDPDHLPQALDAIEAVGRAFPTIPQAACFDTAFHRHMPRVAQMYALPRELWEAGVRRYGFHGLSYEFIMRELRALDGAAADGKVIVAHLGNGASMAAVRGGVGIETTMGFTPIGGLVMGTRPGDLDPGVLLYLLQGRGMDAAAVSTLVNRQAGLLGVSGTSGDMRDLLGIAKDDARAGEAIDLFCYQARKFLGSLAAALGGLDTLVFTGGIGEHAAPVRERICADMAFLGLHFDPERNAADAPIISRDGAPVTIRVMATDEDVMIAGHTHDLLRQEGGTDVSV
ncbi:MAG: acetate/propionate family kinase [Chloroflexota bacterium]